LEIVIIFIHARNLTNKLNIALLMVTSNSVFMQVLPVLRPRTHDKFLDMRYDDMYTPLLERAGLDVVSYQVRPAGCLKSTLRRSQLWLTGALCDK